MMYLKKEFTSFLFFVGLLQLVFASSMSAQEVGIEGSTFRSRSAPSEDLSDFSDEVNCLNSIYKSPILDKNRRLLGELNPTAESAWTLAARKNGQYGFYLISNREARFVVPNPRYSGFLKSKDEGQIEKMRATVPHPNRPGRYVTWSSYRPKVQSDLDQPKHMGVAASKTFANNLPLVNDQVNNHITQRYLIDEMKRQLSTMPRKTRREWSEESKKEELRNQIDRVYCGCKQIVEVGDHIEAMLVNHVDRLPQTDELSCNNFYSNLLSR